MADDDILDGIEEEMSLSEPNDIDLSQVSSETSNIRMELLAYNGDFHGDSIGGGLDKGRREIVFFSIENKTDSNIEIYSDEFTMSGQDGFVYDYVERPWREMDEEDYPRHYRSEYNLDIPAGTKVRYLLMSEPLEDSVHIKKIDYNYHPVEFSLKLPNELPKNIGDPPL